MLKFRWETEFKETEIGEIPKDWEIENLGWAVKSLESGSRPKGGLLKHDPNGILSIGGENITWQGDLTLDNCLRFKEEFYESLKKGKIEKEDILLVKDGATIGKLAYVKEVPEGRAMVNEHVFLIRTDKEKYNPRYLFYYLFSDAGQRLIESAIGGSAQGGIKRDITEIVKIPIFPFEEQSRIATVLSYFDDLIENKKRQNEILEKTAIAIFKNWFVDFEPFKNEEFVDSELGKIPKGWEVKKITEVVKILRGISFDSKDASFEYFEDAIPILRANNIKPNRTIDLTDLMFIPKSKVSEEKKLKELDIVIVGSNGNPELVGNFACFIEILPPKDFSFGSFMYCLRTNSKIFFPFIYCILNSNYFSEYLASVVTGTNISNLKKSDLENFQIVIPPPPILQKFHSLVEPLFQKIINNQKQIMVLRKIRDTLLPLLVFGKLRVEEI